MTGTPDQGICQVVFTVNGPGEIAGWLQPLAQALRAAHPQIRIVVMMLPCVYSTGAEARVAAGLGTVDLAVPVGQALRFVLTGRLPAGMAPAARSLVFHLGGEVALTLLVAARLRASLYAYAEQPLPYGFAFRRVFYNGLNRLPKRLKVDPARLVGELMVDAAALKRAAFGGARSDRQVVGLFPGSRTYMAEFLLPYYAVTVDAVAARLPQVRWVMAQAPFVDEAALRRLTPPEGHHWPALPLTWHETAEGRWLQTPAGNRIEVRPGPEVLATADVALTIPGTNTGELGAGGTPMVVVLPTYRGDEVPLPGLAGHVRGLPLIGRALKLYFARKVLRGLPMLAQPNRRAGRRIVLELVGTDLHPAIAAELERLLTGDTTALRAEIRAAMGRGGAAERLAAEIGGFFTAQPQD